MVNGTLFDLDEPPTAAKPETPRCRLCIRPVRWNAVRQQWGMYCSGNHCNNRERLCQAQGCGRPFTMNVDGAGTKYCSTECKTIGYNPTQEHTKPQCAWCGKPAPAMPRPNMWPYICNVCIEPIRHVVHILKAHHVPHERARQLADDPSCEICGTNLLIKIKQRSHGQPKVPLVVDHDHDCCPTGKNSCGRCVRGLICQRCNAAAGMVRDNPTTARALADYLDRSSR